MKIISAQIQSTTSHPDAKKLKICQVFDGVNQLQVVCGASNARVGMITILAQIGSTTPLGLEIKSSELRGVPSHGMLCSAKDLGISAEGGIIDLPPETKLGIDFKNLPLESLSSIPWFTYKHIESFYQNPQDKKIFIARENQPGLSNNFKLISQTFFKDGKYLYRHFPH